MGMAPGTFARDVLRRSGVELGAGGHARPVLGHSLAGYFWLWLDGDPPTATHHSKRIRPVTNGNGRTHSTLVDSPALVAARTWYLTRVPERSVPLVPLRGPVQMAAVFRFRMPLPGTAMAIPARPGHAHTEKPDLDNSLKGLTDALALRGFLGDDKEVADLTGTSKRWTLPHQRAGIMVVCRTLTAPPDEGYPATPDGPPGVVLPYPTPIRPLSVFWTPPVARLDPPPAPPPANGVNGHAGASAGDAGARSRGATGNGSSKKTAPQKAVKRGGRGGRGGR